jgi:hypothetical protein
MRIVNMSLLEITSIFIVTRRCRLSTKTRIQIEYKLRRESELGTARRNVGTSARVWERVRLYLHPRTIHQRHSADPQRQESKPHSGHSMASIARSRR